MKRFSLGSTFSDNVIVQSKSSSKIRGSAKPKWWLGAGRPLVFTGLLLVGLFILSGRLFQLTVIDGHQFRSLADDNRTRELVRHAPRGRLLDRTGKPLVENVPQFRLLSPCPDHPDRLCSSILTRTEGESLTAKGLPAQHFLEVDYQRRYMLPTETAHVVGYTGEISDEELKENYYTLRKYQRGDQVGRNGAEAVYEEKLRGRNGKELVEVDASGKILRELGRDAELAGEDVTLSLDADLSKAAAAAFPKGKKGAVIVSKPQTGEILAMYSSPSYSLNDFSLGMDQSDYESLINNPDQPLFNRAIGGVYPPGSTYKIVTAMAGLESGTITDSTLIEDTGIITIGPYSFSNWFFTKYGRTDGMVDIVKALAHSNDVYFYKAGEKMGIARLNEWSQKSGVGTILGIEIAGEASGLLPDPLWKRKNFTSPQNILDRQNEWYLGDTYHMAIGQGYLLTTPLQVLFWTDIIANNGNLCQPTIEKLTPETAKTHRCKPLHLKEETIKLITEGMRQACDEGGTAYPLFGFSVAEQGTVEQETAKQSTVSGSLASGSAVKRVPVACKTGTAEFGDKDNKTHAWLTVFAPMPPEALPKEMAARSDVVSGDPEISITVLIEEGGEGSDAAAPVAKKILESWFTR